MEIVRWLLTGLIDNENIIIACLSLILAVIAALYFLKTFKPRMITRLLFCVSEMLHLVVPLGLSRYAAYIAGRICRWLCCGWRPSVFMAMLATAIIWSLSLVARLGDLFAADKIPPLSSIDDAYLMYMAGKGFFYLARMRFQWQYIVILLAVFMLVALIQKARSHVVIEEFVDYSRDVPDKVVKDARDKPVNDPRGLSTLLVSEFARIVKLYYTVGNKSMIYSSLWRDRPIQLVMKVEDVSDFAECFSGEKSEITAGPVKLPVRDIMNLLSRLVRGPRIVGSIHNEGGQLVITARMIGCGETCNWRVESRDAGGGSGSRSIDEMVKELAYKIFNDKTPGASPRWEATRSYVEGLIQYRYCLSTSQDYIKHLLQAEEEFLKAQATDEKFDDASYNLGVVYQELGDNLEKGNSCITAANNSYFRAAEAAFRKAIEKDEKNLDAYYGLAYILNSFHRYEEVIELCDRIICFKDSDIGLSLLTKAYNLRGVSQRYLYHYNENYIREDTPPEKIQKSLVRYACNIREHGKCREKPEECRSDLKRLYDGLRDTIENRKVAVSYARMALLSATFSDQWVDRAKTSVYACLYNLGLAYYYRSFLRGQLEKKPVTYDLLRKDDLMLARSLFIEASCISPSDTSAYYMLGKISYWLGDYKNAIRWYESAIQIDPQNAGYLASLAIAYAYRNENGDAELAVKACNKVVFGTAVSETADLEKVAIAYKKLLENGNIFRNNNMRIQYIACMRLLEYLGECASRGISGLPRLSEELKRYDPKDRAWEFAQVSIAMARAYYLSYHRLASVDSDDSGQPPGTRFREWLDHAIEKVKADDPVHFELDRIKRVNDESMPEDIGNLNAYRQDDLFALIALMFWCSKFSRPEDACRYAEKAYNNTLCPAQKIGQEGALIVSTRIQCCPESFKAKDDSQPHSWIRSFAGKKDLDWECARIFLFLGDAALNSDQPDRQSAEKYYAAAISKLRPEYPDVIRQWRLDESYAAALITKVPDRPFCEVDKVLRENISGVHCRKELGDAYYCMKEHAHALKAYEQALLLDPDSPDIMLAIGICKYWLAQTGTPENRKGELEGAAGRTEQALLLYEYRRGGEIVPAHYWLGRIYCKLERYSESLSHFRVLNTLVSCQPGHSAQTSKCEPVVSMYYLGLAYLKNDMYDECIDQLQRTMEKGCCNPLCPDHEIGEGYRDDICMCEIMARACTDLACSYSKLWEKNITEKWKGQAKEYAGQIRDSTAKRRVLAYIEETS